MYAQGSTFHDIHAFARIGSVPSEHRLPPGLTPILDLCDWENLAERWMSRGDKQPDCHHSHIVLDISVNQSKGHADIPNQGVRHVFRSDPAYRLLRF